MKNLEVIFRYGGWLGMVICLLLMLVLKPVKDPGVIVRTNTTKIFDSTKKYLPPNLPVLVSERTVTVPSNVDTAAILASYFAIRTYSDQVQDSMVRIQIFDTISQNRIFGRRTSYQWLKPVKVVESTTITTSKSNSGIYVGAFAIGSKGYFGIGPQATWLTKKDVSISYSYDVLNKTHQLGTQFRINGRAAN